MFRMMMLVLMVGVALVATFAPARAKQATPSAETSGCSVEPRSEEELAALEATATSATPVALAVEPIAMPEGDPVDAATLNALDAQLKMVVACAESGDLPRLLALYSDRYVAQFALAPEPVPIIPGQPKDALPTMPGTPAAQPMPDPHVDEAVLLEDGRIAAFVSARGMTGTGEIVFFVEEREAWVIDEIVPALPVGSLGAELPLPVQAAVAAAAAEFGVSPEEVTVESYEAVEWPDSALGCPEEGQFYAAVITPGYLVLLTVNGESHEYHTDDTDRAVRCDP